MMHVPTVATVSRTHPDVGRFDLGVEVPVVRRRGPRMFARSVPRRVMVTAITVAAVMLPGCSSLTPPAGDITAYRHFTLFDGTDRAPLADAAMIVDQGRVSWVGPATQLRVPASVTPVDLTGAFVMPGLISLHAHLGNTVDPTQDENAVTRQNVERSLATYAAYGVTTVLSMGIDNDLVFDIRDAQRAGLPSSARVFTTGQGLVYKGGFGGLAGVNPEVTTVAQVEKAVAEQAVKGVDFIKFSLDDDFGDAPKMPPALTQAIIDASHEHHLRVVAHVFHRADARRLLDQGVDGFVHAVRDETVDPAFIEAMRERGTWQAASTLSREASLVAYGAAPTFLDDPFFTDRVPAETLEMLRNPERQRSLAAAPHYGEYQGFFEHASQNLKLLADAGVPYAFGSDSGPPGRFTGAFDHWELQLMVEAGLTPRQVLTAATRRAAEFLHAADLGTLEPSKWADFVVLAADPLINIRNTRTIRAVYIAGREVPCISTTVP
jgi:imidazolonepropionase-like amidohydrolase